MKISRNSVPQSNEGVLEPFKRLQHTRVKGTFDFTLLRDIVANAGLLDKDGLQPDDARISEGPNRNMIIQLAQVPETARR